ncbi:MAG: hypothetical protein WAL92_17475 [Thiogranum sp.]
MKTTQHRSIVSRALPAGLLAASAMMSAYTPTAAGSDSAAYAFGGLLAGHLLTDMRFRQQQQAQEQKQQTEALTSMAYGGGHAARPPVAPHAPAAYSMTPEQKLDQLDKLAAGGYITPAEYKARRKAILDSM